MRSVSEPIPRSAAMCAIGRSLSNAIRTPRWINSSGYLFGRAIAGGASPLARTSSWPRGLRQTRDGSARAALREGLDTLPAAHLDGPELDLRLLVDHRERLVRARVALNNTLQWHLHDLWPELQLPGSSLFYGKWQPRIARRLARAEQMTRVRTSNESCSSMVSSTPEEHRGRRLAPARSAPKRTAWDPTGPRFRTQ